MRPIQLATLLGLTLALCPASAAPFIFYRGILNAASFAPPGLPNGAIAQGSIFSVFGRAMGPADGVQVSAFPLQEELAGVSIEVCQDGACVAAIPLFVRADQINAIMPSNAPLGPSSVRVTLNGEAGNFSPIEVTSSSVGLFAVSSGGSGPGVIQNFVSQTDQPVNSGVVAARPGQVVTLWATGLGPALNADNVAPQAGDLPVDIEIWVGDAQVTNKLYSGRSPCCAGVDQIVFEIPADAPLGCYAPVHLRTAGTVVSNSVTIAVSDRNECDDPNEPSSALLRAGGKLGAAVIAIDRRRSLGGGSSIYDLAAAAFGVESGGPWAYHPDYVSPPPGSCRVSAARGALFETSAVYGGRPSAGPLDAGAELTVSTSRGEGALPRRLGPIPGYLGYLGPVGDEFDPATILLRAGGPVRLSGAEGGDIGPFAVDMTMPEAPNWTLSNSVIDRSKPLTIFWSDAPPSGQIWISGGSTDSAHDAAVVFSCLARAGQNSLTVGSEILSRLPATEPASGPPTGYVSVLARGPTSSFPPAAGLDGGVVSAISGNSVRVRFQ